MGNTSLPMQRRRSDDGADGYPRRKGRRYLLKHLKTVKGDRLNKGELVRMCDGKFSRAEDMEPGLRELEKRGYVALETVRTGGRGRPATMVHLNPEYFQNPSGN